MLGLSMTITLFLPSFDFRSADSTWVGLDKALSNGRVIGFSYEDPMVRGEGKPITVVVNQDPVTGEAIDPAIRAYVYTPGTPFASTVNHPANLGPTVMDLSLDKGKIDQAARRDGAVFTINYAEVNGVEWAYIENATVTRGWQPQQTLDATGDENHRYVGKGKTVYITEGCWWCHTLLPEATQDFWVFGWPPYVGDMNGENPTAFGSDRKAPDLLHVASRNSSREWMMLHFFNPRLTQPNSIMPRFNYLWGNYDVDGNPIDHAQWRREYNEYRRGDRAYPPEVPEYAPDTEIRALIDWVLTSLK